ncbi:MAG TPA: hypothetical protein VJ986_11460 [Gaiellaceae bacterium]|nr:hypothetical protein [Gaiellaceae bacterium]
MTDWLLYDPAGISVLTAVAVAVVAGAAWAAGALGVVLLAATAQVARRCRNRHRDTADS